MSGARTSNLNSPSSSLPVTANTSSSAPTAAAATAAVLGGGSKASEPIAASHLKHNILAWDTTPLHTGAGDTGRLAIPTLGTSPTNLRGTLLREGIFPTEPNPVAIAPASANVSNTSLSNTNNTNVEASSGGSYGYSSRPATQHRRASHVTLVRQPHTTNAAAPTTTNTNTTTSSGAGGITNTGLNSPSTLPATTTADTTPAELHNTTANATTTTTTTNANAVEDELAATGLSFEVEHAPSTQTEDKSHATHDEEAEAEAKAERREEDNTSGPQPSPQPVPIARNSPSAEAAAAVTHTTTTATATTNAASPPAAPQTSLPAPTIAVSTNTNHPYCNYFRPVPEPGRQRWLLSFNASSPSNNSIANNNNNTNNNIAGGGGGAVGGSFASAGNALRGQDGELGSPAWRQSSDALQGWAEMCTGGCTLRKNPTGSHLLFITEEHTVSEEPLMAVSCANCVLLRAAVCLPRGKAEACFSAQAQYRYVMYNASPAGTRERSGHDTESATATATAAASSTPLVYIGLGLTPRLNDELKNGFYLVLAQLNNDGAASVSIGLWRVTERDTIEQQRILQPPQTVRLTHDRLTLRLVIREGEFDVYANDAAPLHRAVAAPGLKLGESYALLLNTGGPVSLRHIAVAEGERPPESRVYQFYANSPTATPAMTSSNSPHAPLNSPHAPTVKHSPPPRGRNSPPSLPQQQQQQQQQTPSSRNAMNAGRDRTSRGNSPPSGANSTQQQTQAQPQSPHTGPYHHAPHSTLNSPSKATSAAGRAGNATRTGTTSGRNSPPSGGNNNNNNNTAIAEAPAGGGAGAIPPAPLPPAMTSPYANTTTTVSSSNNNARPTRRGNYAGQTCSSNNANGGNGSARPSRPGTASGHTRANAHATRRTSNNNNNNNGAGAAAVAGEDNEAERAEGLPPNVDPQLAAAIQAEIMERVPQVAWDDIAGLADGKRLLKEAVLLPLLLPELFVGVVQPWRGVLLFGPPGTGKTMLAKAVATSAKTTFFNISASTLNNKHYGESEKLVRTLFELARHYAPSTIFFDEVDALVSQRSCTEHEASRRVKSEMLQQMDGLHATNNNSSEDRVLVLATTNRPWDLDEAIRRRLEKRIYIPLPDEAGRRALLEKHMAHLNLAADVDVGAIVTATEHFSGADIAVIVRDAAMMPVRRLIDTYTTEEIAAKKASGELEVTAVCMEDFRSALSRAAPSVSKESLDRFAAWAATYGST